MATVSYRKQSVWNIGWLYKLRILQETTKAQSSSSSIDDRTPRVWLPTNTQTQ